MASILKGSPKWWLPVGLVMAVALSGCSRSTSSGNETDYGLREFPLEFSFEGSLTEICGEWSCGSCQDANPAAAAFAFDSTSGHNSLGCIRAGSVDGQIFGNYMGKMYYAGSLELKTKLDFRDADSISLRFADYRSLAPYWPLPQILQGDRNDSRCHVEVSTDDGVTWSKIRTFEANKTTWSIEVVSLDQLAGVGGIRLRFQIYQHAAKEFSTKWAIDDLVLSVK